LSKFVRRRWIAFAATTVFVLGIAVEIRKRIDAIEK
jgi:hypothetical protein